MPAVIAFVSQKGGVGKSTLARALAAVCAQAGLEVVLADLDPRQQTLVHWQQARTAQRISPRLSVEAFDDAAEAVERAEACDLLILDTPGGVNDDTLAVASTAHLIVQPTGPTLDDLHPTVLLFHELAAAGIQNRTWSPLSAAFSMTRRKLPQGLTSRKQATRFWLAPFRKAGLSQRPQSRTVAYRNRRAGVQRPGGCADRGAAHEGGRHHLGC